MSHDILPPSKYGAGTTYESPDGSIKHMAPVEDADVETYKIPVDTSRIAQDTGSIAVASLIMEPTPLGPGFLAESSRRTKLRVQAEASSVNVAQERYETVTNSYLNEGERYRALEYAETQNKIRAAEAVGMTVDQWNANGRPMKGSYSGK